MNLDEIEKFAIECRDVTFGPRNLTLHYTDVLKLIERIRELERKLEETSRRIRELERKLEETSRRKV